MRYEHELDQTPLFMLLGLIAAAAFLIWQSATEGLHVRPILLFAPLILVLFLLYGAVWRLNTYVILHESHLVVKLARTYKLKIPYSNIIDARLADDSRVELLFRGDPIIDIAVESFYPREPELVLTEILRRVEAVRRLPAT